MATELVEFCPNKQLSNITDVANSIAQRLTSYGLIDPDSLLFGYATRRISRAMLKMGYEKCLPICPHPEFLLEHSAIPIAYCVLNDFAYDCDIPQRRRIRAQQSATQLILEYCHSICVYGSSHLQDRLFKALATQSSYSICENNWEHADLFAQRYGTPQTYISKQNLYLFPTELFCQHKPHLKRVFELFFSLQLIVDDLEDFAEDWAAQQNTLVNVRYRQLVSNSYPKFDSPGALAHLVNLELTELLESMSFHAASCRTDEGAVAIALINDAETTLQNAKICLY